MGGAVELPDVHDIILIFQNSGLVVVNVEIIRSAENGHHTGKPGRPSLAIHAVSGILGLMCSNDGKEVILFEERARGRIGEEIRASSNTVVDEIVCSFLLPKFLQRIGPQDIAHETMSRRLTEAINLFPRFRTQSDVRMYNKSTYRLDIFQGMQLWAETPMNAKKLFVHNRRQW